MPVVTRTITTCVRSGIAAQMEVLFDSVGVNGIQVFAKLG
jgi:hypothetical protein